ncbi:MAG: purine permease, partial [Brucella pseudogrignonensis]
LMAIVLNLMFNEFKTGNSDQMSVFAEGTERIIRHHQIAELHDGDYVQNGKLYDAEGNEVKIVPAGAH